MTREEFVKQRCEIDKITEEEFEKTYRVVDCNCGAYYCKGYRCLDLDGLLKEIEQLQQQCRKQKEVIIKVMNLIKKYGKYDGEKCTQGFQMWSADFNKILDILKEASK